MATTNWQDAIVDKSNLWFNAMEMENQGRFFEAANLYLKDSRESISHDSLVRAGLDCACAASCLRRAGNLADAQRLYYEAGSLYEENADTKISVSIREALWSLRLASRYFLLSDDIKKAKMVAARIVFLNKRIDPFFSERRENEEKVLEVMPRDSEVASRSSGSLNVVLREEVGGLENLRTEVSNEVQHFLTLNRSRINVKSGERKQSANSKTGADKNPDTDFDGDISLGDSSSNNSNSNSRKKDSFVDQLG